MGISFGPPLQPPQLVQAQRRTYGGTDAGDLIQRIQVHQDQIAAEQKRIALEREKFEHDKEGDAIDRKKKLLELDQQQELLTAAEIAARYWQTALTAPGGLTADAANAARVRAYKENPKLGAKTFAAFDALAKDSEQAQESIAKQREAAANADVAMDTKAARTTLANQAPTVQQAQLANFRATTTRTQLENAGFDAARISAADALWQRSGQPWGKIRKTLGLPSVKGGLEDTATFAKADTGAAQQRESFAQSLAAANEQLNALGTKGMSTGAFAVFNNAPSGLVGSAIHAGANSMLTSEQQQLVSGYGGFLAIAQAALPRGATSDKDVAAMKSAFTPLAGDSEVTRSQKVLLRNAFVASFSNVNPGEHEDAMNRFLKTARSLGIKDAALLSPFIALRAKLRNADSGGPIPNATDAIINSELGRRP